MATYSGFYSLQCSLPLHLRGEVSFFYVCYNHYSGEGGGRLLAGPWTIKL